MKMAETEDGRRRCNEGNERDERFVKDYVLFIEGASFFFFAMHVIGRVLVP